MDFIIIAGLQTHRILIHRIALFPAGDFVKFGFPMAGAMTQVAWGGVSFQSGYEAAGQIDHLKAMLKWGTDYIIAAHTPTRPVSGTDILGA